MVKNIEDPDPNRTGERERIQAIVNRSFINYRMVDIKNAQNIADDKGSTIYWEDEDKGLTLAEVVSEEKVDNIEEQRSAIRAIGKVKLKQLILRIFSEITTDEYSDGRLAKDFGIPKATFSRFAGSQWHEKGTSIPDLWCNTAMVLSENPVFKDMAGGFRKNELDALKNGERYNAKRSTK
ncbi:MAG: hypothetical protein JRL30_25660 [Deltaproteobacteria bacterium]|nr:hypothetical protein [Deltaproteobacteria bacterium]